MTQVLQKKVIDIYTAFGSGNVPEVLKHLSADVAWDNTGRDYGIPWLKPRIGLKSVEEFFEVLPTELQISVFRPFSFLSNETQVIGMVELEGTVRRTGRVIKDTELHLFTFKDGLVTQFRHFVDTHGHWQGLQ